MYDAELSAQQLRAAQTHDMRVQRELLIDLIAPTPGQHILEIGSGNGILAQEIWEHVAPNGKIVGKDLSPHMTEMAQAHCPNGVFQTGSVSQLDFEDNSFDAVTGAQVLCFVEEIDEAVCEAFRVLKPGGTFVLLDTDWHTFEWYTGNAKNYDLAKQVATASYADPKLTNTFEKRLKNNGFRNISAHDLTLRSTKLEPDSYAYVLNEYIEHELATRGADELRNWRAGLNKVVENGAFHFSLNRRVFKAEKPA